MIAIGSSENNLVVTTLAPVLRGGQSQSSASFSSENSLVVTTLVVTSPLRLKSLLLGGQSQSSASFSSENSFVVTTLVVTSPLRLKSLLLGGQSQSAASFSSENSFIGTATLLRDGWSSPGTTQAWMPALPGIALRRLPNSAAKGPRASTSRNLASSATVSYS